MERKDTLYADTVGDLADGKRGAIPAAIHLDDDTFERLDTLFFALDDADLQTQRITDAKRGEVLAQSALFDLLNNAVHGTRAPGEVEPRFIAEWPSRLNPPRIRGAVLSDGD